MTILDSGLLKFVGHPVLLLLLQKCIFKVALSQFQQLSHCRTSVVLVITIQIQAGQHIQGARGRQRQWSRDRGV